MIHIRPENPNDLETIHHVYLKAFNRENEANLVGLLRRAGKASISLVILDGRRIIGHVLFSPVDLIPNPLNLTGVGMGPVGILPKFQGRGFGSKLIKEGLDVCRQKGLDFTVVVGEPSYYSRFGFLRAGDFNLKNEYGVDDEFRVIEMRTGILNNVSGLIKNQPEFAETNC